jgi:UPF0755 protein
LQVDKLARGDVRDQPTFPEGLSVAEMAKIATRTGSVRRPRSRVPRDLEGTCFRYLSLPRQRRRWHDVMTAQFDHVVTPDLRRAGEAKGLSLRQVVTLASIVEKETARPDERPIVAAVYENRLRIGMALQCDPTVIYALERAGRYTGNLRRDDLAFDSPYNTYRYAGLPPGPIASPGRSSIEAVVHPAAVDFLYFVSRNDGSHVFATTLAEHNRNVQTWQVDYFRERRAEGKGQRAEGKGR